MDRDKKWNLQDIKPAEPRKRRVRKTVRTEEVPVESAASRISRPVSHSRSGGGKKGKSTLVLIGAILLLVIGGLAISALFGGAKVTVYPRFRDPVINTALEAKREAGSGELAYEILTLEAEGERQVTATGQENVTELATGEITIYNSSSQSQRLVKSTRFATPEGLVYHIKESVEVPAASGDTPGTVVADVYADEAGPEFNIAAGVDLTVPGFKESDLMDLYAAVTGKTGDISGGYDGPKYLIDDTELEAAQDSLHSELKEALVQRLASEKPAGFIVFDDAMTFSYAALQSEAVSTNSDSQVMIREKASLKIPIFKHDEFAGYLASIVVPGYEDEPVRLEDTSVLEFTYVAANASSTEVNLNNSINFKLVGKPRLIWEFDADKLRSDLAGALQVSLNTILGGYPAIEKATTSIQPFWSRSFPEDPEKIDIVEVIGNEEE